MFRKQKAITKVQIGMIYKRADGTFYLNADGFMGCASVQDLWKQVSQSPIFFCGDKENQLPCGL